LPSSRDVICDQNRALSAVSKFRSIFRADHEVIARRVLKIAGEAVRIYGERFGVLPLDTVTIVDVPLVATLGSVECSGLAAIAGAFYVDFDSPAMRNMPGRYPGATRFSRRQPRVDRRPCRCSSVVGAAVVTMPVASRCWMSLFRKLVGAVVLPRGPRT